MNDTILDIQGIHKKFCRKTSTSIYYGLVDILKSFLGMKVTSELRKDEFWALRNISLSLKRGECLGIVGANGAGKSTLLKIINEVIKPDKGQSIVTGKMCSLLEVSSGFHPQLTGRENILIRGQILGLSREIINSRMQSIIEFSGIEEFIDSPVKSYSSGMNARLGFAIAAHVDADLLILDEVLAVGDISFRMKCLNFLASIKNQTAIILVSHNMQIISRVCDRAYYIENGQFINHGNPDEILSSYSENTISEDLESSYESSKYVSKCLIQAESEICIHEDYQIKLLLETTKDVNVVANIGIKREDGIDCFGLISNKIVCRESNLCCIILDLKKLCLMPSQYFINVAIYEDNMLAKIVDFRYAHSFRVIGDFKTRGVYQPIYNWTVSKFQ